MITFRIPPKMSAANYVTFGFASPLATHWRRASCEEVDCPSYLFGWETDVDESTERGRAQADYIRHDATRRHTESRREDGVAQFVFEPGQPCFGRADHRARLGAVPRFYVKGGDWRGNPRGTLRFHANAAEWQEDLAEHQDRLAETIKRG